jgi:beta-galactosidase
VSSRGVYHLPLEKYEKHLSRQLTSYDLIAPYWAYCPDVEFAAQEQSPAVLGEFVWTGFDYIGEPTPFFGWKADNSHDWPARSSYFGMVDLAGFPKDRYYLYQSQWTHAPMVHLLPHWNWPDRLGQPIPVMVYSNADEVELLLNGKSLGSKHVGSEPVTLPVGPDVNDKGSIASRYRLLWQVPYAPGTLQAIARRAGVEVARDEVRTAGAAARIHLQADRVDITADGDDLAFITARVEDAKGNLVPDAGNLIQFKVSGAATIAAVDNGNAATVEAFQADKRHAFSGQALLIVRSSAGEGGSVSVVASSDQLASGTAEIHTHAVEQ